MSDESPAKRGRKANAAADTKLEAKKRTKKEAKLSDGESNDESAAPVKRGRGRPKGSTKKKAAVGAKSKGKSPAVGARRGRPKREEPKDSAEEDGEENDAAEDDDE